MKRKTKFSIEPRYILLALSIVCLLLMVLSFKFKDAFMPIRSVVVGTITPMQKGINHIGVFFSEKKNMFVSTQELIAENKEAAFCEQLAEVFSLLPPKKEMTKPATMAV